MKDLTFTVTGDVINLGVKIKTALISGVNNSESNDDFELYKNEELEKIKKELGDKKYKDDVVL